MEASLLSIEAQEIQAIHDEWSKLTTYHSNESGIAIIKKLLKQFGFSAILESMDITAKYLEYKDGSVTHESVEIAFNKIKGICYIRSLPEDKRKEYQEIGSVKLTLKYKYKNRYDEKWAPIYITRFLKSGNTVDLLKELTDQSPSYRDWEDNICSYIQ